MARLTSALALGTAALPRLWAWLARSAGLPLEAPADATRGWDIASLRGGVAGLPPEHARALGLFARLLATALQAYDDEDFYEAQVCCGQLAPGTRRSTCEAGHTAVTAAVVCALLSSFTFSEGASVFANCWYSFSWRPTALLIVCPAGAAIRVNDLWQTALRPWLLAFPVQSNERRRPGGAQAPLTLAAARGVATALNTLVYHTQCATAAPSRPGTPRAARCTGGRCRA